LPKKTKIIIKENDGLSSNDFTFIDLFAGAGGFSKGLEMAGFKCLAGVDFDENAMITFTNNFPGANHIIADLSNSEQRKGLINQFRKYHLSGIVAGIPCQAFSLAGNRDPLERKAYFFLDFFQFVKELQPVFFVIENVVGLTSMKIISPSMIDLDSMTIKNDELESLLKNIRIYKDLKRFNSQRKLSKNESDIYTRLKNNIKEMGLKVDNFLIPLLDEIIEQGKSLDYEIAWKILNAGDFGSAQNRKRVFFVGVKKNQKKSFDFPLEIPNSITAGDVIKDLADKPEGFLPNHDFTKHSKSMIERIKNVKPGMNLYENFKDAWWKIKPDEKTRVCKENHGGVMLNPWVDRVCSPRELARLQGVTDDFVFCGVKSSVLRQIGNMIDWHLSKAIGLALKEFLTEKNCL